MLPGTRHWNVLFDIHHITVIQSPSRVRLFATPWDSQGKSTGVGYHFLLQGIFPTQGSNPGVPLCRWILYQLSHKGSPRIWRILVAYLFSSVFSWPRNQTGVSCIAGGFFTNWAIRKAQEVIKQIPLTGHFVFVYSKNSNIIKNKVWLFKCL